MHGGDMSRVLDYAWGRPSPAKLKAEGFTGVMRYLSHTSGKNLTRDEANELTAAGLDIGVVWETSATRALDGYQAGHDDAKSAALQAVNCGVPKDRPIYFAVDFDVTRSQMSPVLRYLDGAASVLGYHDVGVYGGKRCITMAMDAGILWGWQTYAWSGGQWDPRAQLQQYSNGHLVDGVDSDYNRTRDNDYGQWRVGENPMALSDADKKWISEEVGRVVWTADTCPAPHDDDPNKTWAHENVPRVTYLMVQDVLGAVAALTEKVDTMLNKIGVAK
jgi:hypothetical protein